MSSISTVSGGPSRKIVVNGLVLWFDASIPSSYPGSGTTWSDLTSNGNIGTLTNGPTYSSANGGSIQFDGVDDWVATNNSTLTSPMTYNVWVKWSGSNLFGTIIGNEDYYISNGFGIRRRSDNSYWLSPGVGMPNILGYLLPLSVYSNWHMVTGVLTGTIAIIYLNGSYASQANWSTAVTSNRPFRIGANPTIAPDPFTGNIAAVQVYNRALSAQEVLQNYNATKTRFGL